MPYADPERQRRAVAEARERYKRKAEKRHNAKLAVRAAIQSGKLVKWPGCAACKRKRNLQAHHYDYDRPLDVTWLCIKCHKACHAIVGFRNTMECEVSAAHPS